MRENNPSRHCVSCFWPILGMALVAWGAETACVSAQTTTGTVMRVEEDWALVVAEPDIDNNSPQVTCVISPLSMASGYAAFDINYRTQPNYAAGGLQLHIWNPVDPIVTKNFSADGMLSVQNETITWTQTMSLQQGSLTFQVLMGSRRPGANLAAMTGPSRSTRSSPTLTAMTRMYPSVTRASALQATE